MPFTVLFCTVLYSVVLYCVGLGCAGLGWVGLILSPFAVLYCVVQSFSAFFNLFCVVLYCVANYLHKLLLNSLSWNVGYQSEKLKFLKQLTDLGAYYWDDKITVRAFKTNPQTKVKLPLYLIYS